MLGVIPHSFAYLFEAAKRDDAIKDLTVKIEIVEIYRGKLRDLLEPKDPKKKVRLILQRFFWDTMQIRGSSMNVFTNQTFPV